MEVKEALVENINIRLKKLYKMSDMIIEIDNSIEKAKGECSIRCGKRSSTPKAESPKKKRRRNGDFSIKLARDKSLVFDEYKGGLFAYFWKRNNDSKLAGVYCSMELKNLDQKKDEIFDAIVTLLIAGHF